MPRGGKRARRGQPTSPGVATRLRGRQYDGCMSFIPDCTRVRSVPMRSKTGITTPQTIDGFYRVEWDDGSVTHEAPGMIEPENGPAIS